MVKPKLTFLFSVEVETSSVQANTVHLSYLMKDAALAT